MAVAASGFPMPTTSPSSILSAWAARSAARSTRGLAGPRSRGPTAARAGSLARRPGGALRRSRRADQAPRRPDDRDRRRRDPPARAPGPRRPAAARGSGRPRRRGGAARGDAIVDVAGPLCTGLDVLATDVPMREPRTGDLLAIPDAVPTGSRSRCRSSCRTRSRPSWSPRTDGSPSRGRASIPPTRSTGKSCRLVEGSRRAARVAERCATAPHGACGVGRGRRRRHADLCLRDESVP